MKLNLTVDMTALKLAAAAKIDTSAEAARGLFVTLGSGQAMVYDQKAKEAEAFMANEAIALGEIPHLSGEAALNGIPVFDQAVIYLTMAQQWRTASSVIEAKRLAAKQAVTEAKSPAAIDAATLIDWSELQILN
jgi:hypothetical protein